MSAFILNDFLDWCHKQKQLQSKSILGHIWIEKIYYLNINLALYLLSLKFWLMETKYKLTLFYIFVCLSINGFHEFNATKSARFCLLQYFQRRSWYMQDDFTIS